MITVRFLGGARKSFRTDQTSIAMSDVTLRELIDCLLLAKPDGSPDLDPRNMLVAVNGAESSALDGEATVIKHGDIVTIIPVVHGGSIRTVRLDIANRHAWALEIGGLENPVRFLDGLRAAHPACRIQAVSSRFVLNDYHLHRILHLSLRSERLGTLLSNRVETDMLMRLALSPQISDAIRDAGLKPGKGFILICVGPSRDLSRIHDEVLPLAVEPFSDDNAAFLRRHFGITGRELDSVLSDRPLEDILAERAAVL